MGKFFMLLNKQRRNFSISSGFTLIELLVVIAIIGILASVVISSLDDARASARDTKRLLEVKQLQTALEVYANKNGGRYPCHNGSLSAVNCSAPVRLNSEDISQGSGLRNALNLQLAPDDFRANNGSFIPSSIRYRLGNSANSTSIASARFDSYTILVFLERERTNAAGVTFISPTPCKIVMGQVHPRPSWAGSPDCY